MYANLWLYDLDETGRVDHPTTPAGLYETMQLPDPVVARKTKHGIVKQDFQANARKRDKEEIRRRKGDVDTEARRDDRVDGKRRKVEEEGYEQVSSRWY